MYSASWYGTCKKAKKYFRRNGIPFTNDDIEKSSRAKKLYEQLGASGVPLIIVGKKRMNGFSEAGFSAYLQVVHAHAHLNSNDDELVSVKPMLESFPDWGDYLGDFQPNELLRNIRKHTRTGRPLGSESFIETLESLTGRSLKPLKPGRKPIK